MKPQQLFLGFAMMLACGSVASAQENILSEDVQTEISEDYVQLPTVIERDSSKDELATSGIGRRIVREIARGILDRDERRRHEREHRRERERYPDRDRYPDEHEHNRQYYTCYAQNGRGDIFSVAGYNAYAAQDRALEACYSQSRRCRALGCE